MTGKETFADKIINFNRNLEYTGELPAGIGIMNPYRENPEALTASTAFYRKYYDDNQPRHLILGINPGRFGSGLTGVAFTDPKRLLSECGIPYNGPMAHEPSSEYIYEMIHAFGGVEAFNSRFYINSVCPLGFTTISSKGNEVNYNYYDQATLTKAVYPFIAENLRKHVAMGFEKGTCFCFGTGKNFHFLQNLNKTLKIFQQIVPLEHPRYILQYKSKTKAEYISKYLEAFHMYTNPADKNKI